MSKPSGLLQGTLDLLILRTLALGPMHGWAVAARIQQTSQEVLQVTQGALYPALHRLEQQGRLAPNGAKPKPGGRQVLYSHPCRPRSARKGAGAVGTLVRCRRTRHPHGGGVNGMYPERWLHILRLRLRSLLRHGAIERELDRELRFHLDQEIERNVRGGLTAPQARTAALRRLGGIAQIQEECRETPPQLHRELYPRPSNTRAGRSSKPRSSRWPPSRP